MKCKILAVETELHAVRVTFYRRFLATMLHSGSYVKFAGVVINDHRPMIIRPMTGWD